MEASVGTTFCAGDGAGAPCPCDNESLHGDGAGCVNPTGDGGRLEGYGTASVLSDDHVAVVSHIPAGTFAVLVAGTVAPLGGFGSPLGDGLRCLGGGTIVRFPVAQADASGLATWGPGLSAFAGFGAGETWYLQAYYRDTVGPACGSEFNTTNARSVVFVP